MTKSIALIGAGPVGLGFILQMAESLRGGASQDIRQIDIFDSYGKYGLGAGLPYDPQTTDFEHLLNVEAKKFAPQQVQSTSSSNVVVIGVEQLQSSEVGFINPGHC